MKKDIENREDILQMVEAFYEKLLKAEEMQYLFFEVAAIDLEAHKPILCDFWESMLFFTGGYNRNTMKVHMDLHFKHPLVKKHFDLWLETFDTTIDTLFAGTKAEEAKTRAKSIASVIQMKIDNLENHGLKINK